MKEYKRKCKDCDDIIVYNSRNSYSKANKQNCSCRPCGRIKRGKAVSGANNCNWKGGVYTTSSGYRKVYQGYMKKYKMEHRLVMEENMGRLLLPEEVVHHINGIKDDNRIENLMLFNSQSDHLKYHTENEDK
jgi:hypothetical protein